ncbi:MAG: class I SAM-dependent methyltransferase [Pyrinomonadaceae bacterium]
MSNGKELWESYGVEDAYFAVATFEKYRDSELDDAARAEFFESGRQHVEEIWSEFESRFNMQLRPRRALDYGCGVGRILLPMAGKCGTVTGIDISDAMLAETGRNLNAQRIENVRLSNVDEFMMADHERFDLIHSYIVLQHMHPNEGDKITEKMLGRLEPGGVGMLHFTFKAPLSFRTLRAKIYRDVPGLHRLLRGSDRLIPLYGYDRDHVVELLGSNGCTDIFMKPTDHGMQGAMIFFRKVAEQRPRPRKPHTKGEPQ